MISRGLMKEKAIIREAQEPLLFLERQRYLIAIGDALAGPDGTRLPLTCQLTN